jgi:hypothetical protein
MAVEHFATDFSEYTPDVQPSDWTERWHTTVASSTVITSSGFGFKQLETVHSSDGRYYLSWDTPGPDYLYVNVEVLAKVMFESDELAYNVRIVLHGTGGDTNEDGYLLDFFPVDDEIRITEFTSGSASALGADVAKTLDIDTWYWVRFRRNGSDLKAKVWEDGTPEPGSWDIERTDASNTEGRVGFGSQRDTVHCDWFSVATEGGTAARPVRLSGTAAAVSSTSSPVLKVNPITLAGSANATSSTSTPSIKIIGELSGTAVAVSSTSTPILNIISLGNMPLIIIIT